jgi:branched-chain amino acid transport system permease protein
MIQFAQQLLNGVATGSVYALLALGFVLVYKATGVMSFVHGDLMMLGAFAAYTLIVLLGAPFVVGVIGVMLAMALVGAVLNRVLVQPMIGRPMFGTLLVTLGAGSCLRGIVMLVPQWGTDNYRLTTPLSGIVWHIGPLVLNADAGAAMLATAAMIGVFFVFFQYTKLGTAMRAVALNHTAATYVGIPVKTIYSLIWAVSAMIAGLAGMLLAPLLFINVGMGFLGLKALPAAIIGGITSLPGAICGGVLIGVMEALTGFYLPDGAKDITAYVLLLVMLVLRPDGIFPKAAGKHA